MKKILIIGYGRLGSALANGWQKSKNAIVYVNSRSDKNAEIQASGLIWCPKIEQEILDEMDYILIATRNDDIKIIIDTLNNFQLKNQKIISVAAGISKETIASYLNKMIPIIRILPNVFARINKSCTLIEKATFDDADLAFFQLIGSVHVVKDSQFSEATILSGCNPAYIAYFVEIMKNWGEINSLNNEMAKMMICDVLEGTSQYLKNNVQDIQNFINDVCTPGGVTIEGLTTLKSHNLEDIIHNAFDDALKIEKK